jgi:1-deoxy-D-xylulose-5-phosphate synthase
MDRDPARRQADPRVRPRRRGDAQAHGRSRHFCSRSWAFKYLGPYDGHDLDGLIDLFEKYKRLRRPDPRSRHHEEGEGLQPCRVEADLVAWRHSVRHRVGRGEEVVQTGAAEYTAVFADTLIELAKKDEKIVAVTAAMPEGTGLDKFGKGIPIGCSTSASRKSMQSRSRGGLATQGMKPIAAIYSTFLQRAFDQVFHDVAIMDLPVVFALDRGGIAGADGPTHHGIYDMAYLRLFPNMICMAPKDENELRTW